MVIILGWSLGILADKVAKVMSWSEMPRGHVPFCLTRSFLFVTMRTINVLEWLVLLVGPFTTFLILNCSSILFLSYNVSPRSSSNRSVLKSPRITIFENFVHIFSFNFGNAVKNSLFWFGGQYIVPTRMSLESAFHWKKTQKSNVVFTWFWHGFCKIQPPIITMFGFNLVFSWFFCEVIKITVFSLSWILKETASPWVLRNPTQSNPDISSVSYTHLTLPTIYSV